MDGARRDGGGLRLAAEFGEEVGGVDWFGEDLELVALGAGFFEEVGGGGLAGEEKNLAVGAPGAGGDGGFDAGHAGHDDVGDEHVGFKGIERFDGFFAAVDGARLEARLIEDDGEGVGDHLLIVGDEDARLLRRIRCCI